MSLLSPSVSTISIDRSHYIPNYTNEVAAFVGYFEQGPINTPTFITDIFQFKYIFGRGIGLYHNDWYQVYNYLQYSSGIWVIRTSGNRQYNASNEDRLLISSKEDFEEAYNNIKPISGIKFIAQTPGEWGNILKVAIIYKTQYDSNVTLYGNTKAKDVYQYFEDGYVGICIFRLDDLVENYYFLENEIETINNESEFVYVKYDTLEQLIGGEDLETSTGIDEDLEIAFGTLDLETDDLASFYDQSIIVLQNGSTNFPVEEDIEESYQLLRNKEDFDIDIIIGNEKYNIAAVNLAEHRKDCIAFIGIPSTFIEYIKLMFGPNIKKEVGYSQQGTVLATHETKPSLKMKDVHFTKLNQYIESIPQSQFVHFTLNVKEQTDGFSSKNKYVNIAADCAGLKAQASLITPWTVSAGLERGAIRNVNKIFYLLSGKLLDKYYKMGLNFVQNNMLMTQKTYYTKQSSFNRIHTRSLFNHIEKECEKLLRNYIFEDNTYQRRGEIASILRRYLENVRINNGIEAGLVEVQGKDNEIIVDVYIQPMYVAEYIQLRMKNVGGNTTTSIASAALT